MHLVVIQLQDAAKGCGIAYGTENIVVLVFLPVSGNLHMNRMNIRQGTDPFQNIGGMTDNVLHILGRGPGNAGKGTEGSSIAEITVGTEKPHIQRTRISENDGVAGEQRCKGKLQPAGKIVGAAAGDVAQGRPMTALLQTGDHFIEGAVAAAGHDQIRFTRVCPGKIHRVPALFRYINGTEVSRLVEDGNHLGQETAALAGSGIGIDDQVERFQFIIHNSLRSLLPKLRSAGPPGF